MENVQFKLFIITKNNQGVKPGKSTLALSITLDQICHSLSSGFPLFENCTGFVLMQNQLIQRDYWFIMLIKLAKAFSYHDQTSCQCKKNPLF